MEEGLCQLFVAHTTAGLTINENADPSVPADILMVLNRIISDKEAYRHLEGNSPAHIKASLMGPQLTILVSHGSPGPGHLAGGFSLRIRRSPDP